ncbi:MAG: NGG1p interacting factor NIF3 [Actinomycetota bacterium]|nr:NGG1p interacting factor NIF3 [Actinomycetota bacterium]
MKLGRIYETAIKAGIEKDPRGKEGIRQLLEDTRSEYESLGKKEKKYFDKDRLTNPFSDTRILYGSLDIEVKRVIVGIDVEVQELVLVDRLRERGKTIDLCIAHHPEGKALAKLSDVMALQADVWASFGVPVNIGDALITERMREIQRAFLPQNHQRSVQAAELLDIPFMCVHTPADNLVTNYLSRAFERKKPRLVSDVVDVLLSEEEYQKAATRSTGPQIVVGDRKTRAGKVLVDMTGGTEGPVNAIEKLAQAGVGTIVAMHMNENLRKEAEKQHLNVVIAGHIASDSLGVNLFLDRLEKEKVECLTFSGLERISRVRG